MQRSDSMVCGHAGQRLIVTNMATPSNALPAATSGAPTSPQRLAGTGGAKTAMSSSTTGL